MLAASLKFDMELLMSRASDRAYSEIRSLILSGDAPPGAPLREEQLADLCGVSRTPVRDALRRLESELYVVRTESQRTFVADWSREDVEEMFALRAMLEAHAARRAAERMSDERLDELTRCNAKLELAVCKPEPDVVEFLDRNREFHASIIEAASSPRLTVTLAALVEQPVVRRTAMRYGRTQLEQSVSEHRELLNAFAAHDPEWAHAVMTGHIRRAFHAFTARWSQESERK